MACSECGARVVTFAVPPSYREYAPDDASTVAFCTRCLTVDALEPDEYESNGETTDSPPFDRVSDAFPTDPDRAIPLALAIGLCSSLATNRDAIESLLRDLERAGVDPLLVVERLEADPSVEPAVDLGRRAHQLEQLLY
ncbi:DUF6276 family protein [Natrarchaeobius oligotrophus]|uniref:Small CPxCG-related zinc finger protein n=1 Tax=Natrarchaeobius chitinivorans TaxID=1679083 RepID=A0A3N6PBL5_NATCH|nr:DUF6276 family protein [Natrarchaeobius chitinivorans]RQG96719.1 hypothetical protein EA472_20410 [Natrarchaeobius chitinivorans]